MIILRKAQEKDLDIIRDLAHRIWPLAYSAYISERQLTYMLEKMYSHGELLSQLQQGHVFLIAEDGDTDVGFAGYSKVDSTNQIYKLHKLYVLPETQGKGIGKILINEVVHIAKNAGGKTLQLNVNRNNNALNFYKKAGFTIKEAVDIDIDNGFFMNDYILEKPL